MGCQIRKHTLGHAHVRASVHSTPADWVGSHPGQTLLTQRLLRLPKINITGGGRGGFGRGRRGGGGGGGGMMGGMMGGAGGGKGMPMLLMFGGILFVGMKLM